MTRALMAAAVLSCGAGGAVAQSLTNGALRVRVVDRVGVVLPGTDVTVVETGSGSTRTFRVNRSGEFTIPLIQPGSYDVSGELLGYQPQRVTGVPVHPGRAADVTLQMDVARFPVRDVDVVEFQPTATAGSLAGVRLAFPDFLVAHLPSEQRDLGRLLGDLAHDFSTQGLPAASTGVLVDGMLVHGARYYPSQAQRLRPAGLDLGSFARAAFWSNEIDVEVAGYGAGVLTGETRRGTRAAQLSGYGLFGNSALSSSSGFRGATPDFTNASAGVSMSGPIIRDTAHFLFTFRAQQLERPYPRVWEMDDALDARAVETAREEYDLDLASYTRARTLRTDIFSAFGRVDWQIADAHHVDVRASMSTLPKILAAPGLPVDAGAAGSDLWVGAMATSQLMDRVGHEFRISAERTMREGTAGFGEWLPADVRLPSTHIVEGALSFGPEVNSVDRFERTGITASQTAYVQSANHRLKLGSTVTVSRYDYTHDPVLGAQTFFGSLDGFARREGAAVSAAGPLRVAQLTLTDYGVYVQDSWQPTPEMELVLGARYDVARSPSEEARVNERWVELSDVTGTGMPRDRRTLSPRFALTWRPGGNGRSTLQASGGVFYEPHDPALLADALTQDGTTQVRRQLGTLERWPAASGSSPDGASVLTLLTPGLAAPRTVRAAIGLSQMLRSNLALHVSGTVRQTRNLPRSADLNLQPTALGRDQYGRALYGRLVQQSQLLAAAPGSNRRFPSFDVVSAWAASGSSNYWDVSAAFERRSAGSLQLYGSYTYSRATDDWQPGAGAAGVRQFPSLLSADISGAEWLDATSDFDATHRLLLAAEVKLPSRLGPRLTTLYRIRSGAVFTPGFRAGVDANADGVSDNDPAFVDDELEGFSELRRSWDCLRTQVGRFAERNSCRAPATHIVDARLAWSLVQLAGVNSELLVEALNLFDAQMNVPDQALVLVDGARELEIDPASGLTRVPLVINPHFGQPLLRSSSGRALRIGLRLSH